MQQVIVELVTFEEEDGISSFKASDGIKVNFLVGTVTSRVRTEVIFDIGIVGEELVS